MLRRSNLRRLGRILCTWLLVLSIFNAQMVWAVDLPGDVAPTSRVVSDVKGLMEQLEPLKRALDNSLLDLESAVFRLDFDAAEIEHFVAEEIRFQAYPGLLRSAHGTLISRSGNALDQGVLLARMLEDAGFEARIARGRLAAADASRLLEQMTGPTRWPSAWAGDQQKAAGRWLSGYSSAAADADALQADAERVLADSFAAVEAIGSQVEEIVSGSGSAPLQERLIEETMDYFWVEHRLGPGDSWVAAHPAFGGAEQPLVSAQAYMTDTVPDKLQHRVRIAVKMEKRLGGKLEQVSLMSPWERPAANAAYLPQSISVVPYADGMAGSDHLLELAARESELYVLAWNDAIAAGAQAFTLQGDSLPLDALSASGDFFKQVADQGAKAVDALGGLGLSAAQQAEQAPAKRLERLWIEYTMIAPDGSERTQRRYLLDLDADGRRLVHQQPVGEQAWLSEARAAILQSRSLLVGTGPVHPGWLSRKLVESADQGRATLLALERRVAAVDASETAAPASLLKGLDALPDTRWIRYLHATQTATGFGEGAAAYLHQPMLVSFNHGVRAAAEDLRGYEQIDILFNDRRVVRRGDSVWKTQPTTAALAGVLETQAEHLQMQARGGERSSSAFSSLATLSTGFTRVSPNQRSALAGLDLAPGALRAAELELDAGYALLVPRAAGVDHWWRVDPGTGSVTGMGVGAGGYAGIAAAEYIVLLGITIGTLLMYYSFYNCFQSESGLALFCCLVDSWLTGIIIAAIAAGIAAIITWGIGAAASSMGAATAEAELVTAIVNFAILDVTSTALSFTDLRLQACGSLTGT